MAFALIIYNYIKMALFLKKNVSLERKIIKSTFSAFKHEKQNEQKRFIP